MSEEKKPPNIISKESVVPISFVAFIIVSALGVSRYIDSRNSELRDTITDLRSAVVDVRHELEKIRISEVKELRTLMAEVTATRWRRQDMVLLISRLRALNPEMKFPEIN